VKGNIGTAIEASSARQRLQEVLVETQQLNEELQVQQEELRTANEELEEQSRVLEASQASLENQKAELEQTNEQLAEQANRWTRKTPSCKGAAGWKSAPASWSAPASTSRSSWPICRTSCARR
jgi:septal ring factor EnvC (AmiA/AmiB activator)